MSFRDARWLKHKPGSGAGTCRGSYLAPIYESMNGTPYVSRMSAHLRGAIPLTRSLTDTHGLQALPPGRSEAFVVYQMNLPRRETLFWASM